jgi:hypothetical protein
MLSLELCPLWTHSSIVVNTVLADAKPACQKFLECWSKGLPEALFPPGVLRYSDQDKRLASEGTPIAAKIPETTPEIRGTDSELVPVWFE